MYRSVCAALVVSTGIYAAYGVLAGSLAFIGIDQAHPTGGRILVSGGLVSLLAAVWAAVLARSGSHRGSTVLTGAAGGVVFAGATFYLYFGGAPPQPARTTIGVGLVGVQVAAVPVVAWLLRGPRGTRPGPAVLTGLMVLVGGGTMIYASVTHQVEARETITHQVAAVIVESGRGDITIHASGARGTVQVIRRGRLRVGSDLAPLEFSDGNTLIIDDQTDDSETSGISYEVRVPAGVRIGATTFSGTIDADGDFSSVVLQTATGTVETELSATTVFAYATTGGRIDLRLQRAPTQLTSESDSGDIDVRLPADQAYTVETRSGSGVTHVTVQQDSTSTHQVKATSGTGNITIQPG